MEEVEVTYSTDERSRRTEEIIKSLERIKSSLGESYPKLKVESVEAASWGIAERRRSFVELLAISWERKWLIFPTRTVSQIVCAYTDLRVGEGGRSIFDVRVSSPEFLSVAQAEFKDLAGRFKISVLNIILEEPTIPTDVS